MQQSSRIFLPMLANVGRMVKRIRGMHMRRLARALLRVVVTAGLVAAVTALVRAALDRLAGDPAAPRTPEGGVPMSFDSWPPVPSAPAGDER